MPDHQPNNIPKAAYPLRAPVSVATDMYCPHCLIPLHMRPDTGHYWCPWPDTAQCGYEKSDKAESPLSRPEMVMVHNGRIRKQILSLEAKMLSE